MRDFRKYDIGSDGVEFVTAIYEVTDRFPPEERFGLTSLHSLQRRLNAFRTALQLSVETVGISQPSTVNGQKSILNSETTH